VVRLIPNDGYKNTIARVIAGAIVFIVGGATQILLWKTPAMGYWMALSSHSYLWLVYLLVGLFIGEHILKWLSYK
jgi:membrane protein YdbS with pleckstrin-like domain